MKKIPKLKYKDVYNQVTGEYFPKLIDDIMIHLMMFPSEFDFINQNSWEATLPRDPGQMRDVYELCLTKKWEPPFVNKLKMWQQEGYPIRFLDHEGIVLGKITHIKKETLIRDDGELTIRIPNIKPLMRAKDVPLLEVVKLTTLEYCEVLEYIKK